jgi:hypothetical protein
MTRIPTVILPSLMPRRIFLPLEHVRGRQGDQLFKRARKQGKVAVYWQVDTLEEGKASVRWERAIVAMSERLPRTICESSVSAWAFSAGGKVKATRLNMPLEPSYLDLAIGLAGGSDFGLMITWNPRPNQDCQEINHLLITERNPSEDSTDDTALRELVSGEPLLALYVPRIALLPLPESGDPESSLPLSPPDGGIIDWTFEKVRDLWGLLPWGKGPSDFKWQFRPSSLHVWLKRATPRAEGCAIALDFGTCASTIAYLPIRSHAGNDQAPADPLVGLLPWTHACSVPAPDRPINPKHIAYDTYDHVEGTLIKGIFPVVPHHVQANRLPLSKSATSSAHVHSLLYVLPKRDLRDKAVGETVLAAPQCIIGSEAWNLVDRDLKQRDFAGVEWDRYVFAPKSLVGKCVDVKLPVEKLVGENPTELFLTEFLDQAFYRLISTPAQADNLHPPIEFLSYSYPVAWTDEQRRQFHRHLVQAVQKSAIKELLPDGGIDRVLTEDQAMDEGSAAFLGFVMERFGGLEGGDLLRVFQPFDPRPTVENEYPKKLNVLVFDCGEGTTDVVWLEIVDNGDAVQPGQPLPPVDSQVRRHFAMEKAGLEITRRIAERIKEHLRMANPSRSADWLRTNILDEGIGDRFHTTEDKQSEGQYRRGLTNLLYVVAERLKLGLVTSSQPIPWTELRERTGATQVPTCALTAEELEQIVREVFQVAADQIRLWFHDGPRVDLVIMSGRSSRLPGMDAMIRSALPENGRPYAIDFVTPGAFRLGDLEENSRSEETSKNVVCTGLALNLFNRLGLNLRAIRSNPINKLLRTRAIGVLAEKFLQPLPAFHDDFDLLVNPDNGPITPNTELAPIVVRGAETHGFYLGINFGGRLDPNLKDCRPDTPQPFCRVNIRGGGPKVYSELRFYFSQRSATDIRLARVEMQKPGGELLRKEIPEKEPLFTSFTIGPLQINVEPFARDQDFRNTGRIHIDSANPIDHDR